MLAVYVYANMVMSVKCFSANELTGGRYLVVIGNVVEDKYIVIRHSMVLS